MNIFIGDCKNIDGNRKTARSTIHGVIAWNFLLEEGGGGVPLSHSLPAINSLLTVGGLINKDEGFLAR